MDANDLKSAILFGEITTNSLFSSLNIISRYIMQHGATDRHALDAIIRLRELVEKKAVTDPKIIDAIQAMCREAGLFPYLQKEKLNWRDQITYEFFKGPDDTNYVFHREQWQAFQLLTSGKSLLLSAPTSFGKSVLIHAFIAHKKPNNVVIVVPTIALLDQFRRRLSQYFASSYSIITRNDQSRRDEEEKCIYVLTQERLLDRTDVDAIDLLAIDEYYKLDSERESKSNPNNRSTLLNAALRKHMSAAKQIFFLGPAVTDVPMRKDIRERFVNFPSSTSTVAVDVHDYKNSDQPPHRTLAGLISKYGTDKSLIFSKSPPAARRLVEYLIDKNPLPASKELSEFAEWLAEHYNPNWILVDALKAGYGIHHGSVPRSVAQILVRYFNEGNLNALICTSTLIEGVNTAAKNVFIFDKKISNTNFDYFDFRNIAGRSGRMGHHLVGRIFLFHEPPAVGEFVINAPALSDDSAITDNVLLNLPDETLSSSLLSRKNSLFANSQLPRELVERFAPYGMGGVDRVSEKIAAALDGRDESFLWTGFVRYQELRAVFSIAWNELNFNKKRLSAESAAFYANRLSGAQNLKRYFDGLLIDKDQLEYVDQVERGFRALGLFDYSIPKLLSDMEALVNYHCNLRGLPNVDYSYMAQRLDNVCSHHWIKALDEYGIPIPLGRKLEFLVREEVFTLEDAVDIIKAYVRSDAGRARLTTIEREIVETALQ